VLYNPSASRYKLLACCSFYLSLCVSHLKTRQIYCTYDPKKKLIGKWVIYMRVLLAPDSFKGALSALEACAAMAEGVRAACPDAMVDLCPVADGGEGTTASMLAALGGELIEVSVADLLGQDVQAAYARLPDGTAVMEVAAVVSRSLLGVRSPDVLRAHTVGVGQLMTHALEHGAQKLIIGLGGSATTDAGLGMLHALGVRLLDHAGHELPPFPLACLALATLDLAHLHPRLAQAQILVACDVTNPLCGPLGAAQIYGPQKGATAEQLVILEKVLTTFADVVCRTTSRHVAALPGGGAAGGLGAALHGVLGASLHSGIDLVLDVCAFDARVAQADLVVTGEGQTDGQTLHGKVVAGVARRALQQGKPVICLSGAVAQDADRLHELGVTALFSIAQGPSSLEQAMADTRRYLRTSAREVMRVYAAGRLAH